MNSRNLIALFSAVVTLTASSCSIEKQIKQQANKFLLQDSVISQAHIGIAVQELESKKWLYQFQSDKLYTPASNTKIVSCYTAMKYLPDHLPAGIVTDIDTALLITPTGDPTFLHPRFRSQPFFDYLKSSAKPLYINATNFSSTKWGHGWSWEDYAEDYMIERSAFPVYGNQIEWYQERSRKDNPTNPSDTTDVFMYSSPEINWKVDIGIPGKSFQVDRSHNENHFTLHEGKEKTASTIVPFITNGLESAIELLRDTLHKNILIADKSMLQSAAFKTSALMTSQPTDSMLKDMMDRSDNFFADMCIEMSSQLSLKKMDESAAITNFLKNDFSNLPQKPKWVDGSGLSRYNLFSPEDMIWILQKMKEEFGWERTKGVMPGAGSSNLKMYPVKNNEYIFAKTGTLNGVVCLSGFYLNKKNKWLSFSIMVNNHNTSSAYVRKKIANFLETL